MPEDISFQTKPQLARKMLKKAFTNGITAKWITGDEVYGDNGELRHWLESENRSYVLATSCSSYVSKGFEQLRVDDLVKTVSLRERLSAGEGSKGHRWHHHITLAMFAHVFLTVICCQENGQKAKKGDTVNKISTMKEFKKRRGILSR